MKTINTTNICEKQHRKGKLHIEEKIGLLFDKGSFRTLGENGACGFESIVTGYGTVEGRKIYMYAHNSSIRGGTVGLKEGRRIRNLIVQAVKHGRPVVGIQDSGGARIQEGILALTGYGEVLKAHAMAAGVVPQVMIITGTCAGGAAYAPGLADFTFMAKDIGYMFVTGPGVVEKSCGQKCTLEEVGGAQMYRERSGAAHFCCKNEAECYAQAKRLLLYLSDVMDAGKLWKSSQIGNWIQKLKHNLMEKKPDREKKECCGNDVVSGLMKIVPSNGRKIYDMCKVIERIMDKDSFLEIRKGFAGNIVTGLGKIGGRTIGIVANQPMEAAGALDCDAAVKGASFVRFCSAYGIPVVTLADTPGFLPGVRQEQSGMIRHGAKLLFAYGEADTVKLTVILRKAYGGAYICMGSKALGTDAVYAWPGAEIAVMGAECAISILHKRELAQMGETEKQEFIKGRAAEYRETFLKRSMENAFAYGCIDGWLEPEDTRRQLINDLNYYGKKRKRGKKGKKEKGYGLVPL